MFKPKLRPCNRGRPTMGGPGTFFYPTSGTDLMPRYSRLSSRWNWQDLYKAVYFIGCVVMAASMTVWSAAVKLSRAASLFWHQPSSPSVLVLLTPVSADYVQWIFYRWSDEWLTGTHVLILVWSCGVLCRVMPGLFLVVCLSARSTFKTKVTHQCSGWLNCSVKKWLKEENHVLWYYHIFGHTMKIIKISL